MMNYKRWALLAIIGILDMESNASFSLLSSFFPKEAFQKGADDFWVGSIFSIFQLARFIIFLTLGTSLHKIGLRRSIISGIVIVATSTLAFSCVHLIPNKNLFIAACLCIRGLQGLGCCLYLLAVFVFTSQEFKDDIGIAFGFIETCEGLGALGGHAFGGWLYMKGGFKLPFLSLGAIITFTIILASSYLKLIPISLREPSDGCLLVEGDNEFREEEIVTEEDQGSRNGELVSGRGKLLAIPSILFTCIVVFSGSLSVSYMVSFVSLYLDESLIFVTLIVGLGFVPCVTQSKSVHKFWAQNTTGCQTRSQNWAYSHGSIIWLHLFSLCIGALINKLDKYSRMAIMLLATLLMSSVYFLTGPLWFNHFDKSQTRWAILFALMGFAYAAQLIPAIAEFFSHTKVIEGRMAEDIKNKSIVSGVYNSVLSLGSLIGPILGGAMIQSIGLGDSALVVAGLNVLVTILFLTFYLYQNCKSFTSDLEETLNQ